MEYTCKHCGKCFDKPGTLKRHKAIHSGRKPYMCSHCGKTFNDPSSCRRHVRTQHKEKKAGFNQVRNLQQHENMHAERKCNKQQPDISQEKKREVRQRGPSQPLKPVRSKTANRKKGRHSKDLHSLVVLVLNTSCTNVRNVIEVFVLHLVLGDIPLYIQTRDPINVNTVADPLMTVGIVLNMKGYTPGKQIYPLMNHAPHKLPLYRDVMQLSQKAAGFAKNHLVGRHFRTTMRSAHAY